MIDHTNSVTKKPSLFEIVGLVTVLVSVFFVGYELRQANHLTNANIPVGYQNLRKSSYQAV